MKTTITDVTGTLLHTLNLAVPGEIYKVTKNNLVNPILPVGSVVFVYYSTYLEQMLCFGFTNGDTMFSGLYISLVDAGKITVRAYKVGESFTVKIQ